MENFIFCIVLKKMIDVAFPHKKTSFYMYPTGISSSLWMFTA